VFHSRCLFLLFVPSLCMGQTRIIPHLTRAGGDFTTSVVLENATAVETRYTLKAYSEGGVMLGAETGTVPLRQSIELDPVAIFGAEAAWLEVDDATDTSVSVAYRANLAGSGPAHVGLSNEISTGWRFRGGLAAVTWDGIAVVNRGDSPARVTVRRLDGLGAILAETVVSEMLAVNGKQLVVLTGLLTDDADAIYELISDQPVALTALRGAQDGSFLWANAASAVAPVGVSFHYDVAVAHDGLDVPVWVGSAGDGSDRLYVVEQSGRIIGLDEDTGPTVFLDLTDRVAFNGEMGLLGLAFHPDYAVNGRFFVNYTTLIGGRRSIVSHFEMVDGTVDPESEVVLLDVPQPFGNHNGGELAFGSDGMLYIGFGDGGSGGDPLDNGQRPSTLLGSILRLDVDVPAGGPAYAIPEDNPFVGAVDGTLPETYAFGFRNPWRFSFDGSDLWVADVGQDRFEEVGLVGAGENHGWRTMEGFSCFQPSVGCDTTGLTMPVYAYDHDQGDESVTGGFVYRGKMLPGLGGAYVFGDFVSGRVWSLRLDGGGGTSVDELFQLNRFSLSAFGLDSGGELLICDYDGRILRLVAETDYGVP